MLIHPTGDFFRVFRNITIKVVEADITEEQTDAIVNAANNELLHGGGVAGAILEKGGNIVQEESDQWVQQHGPVETGEVTITGGGNLHCRYIIHAVRPVYEDGNHNEAKLLELSVMNSLKKASDLRLKSISIPAISSGILDFQSRYVPRSWRIVQRSLLKKTQILV